MIAKTLYVSSLDWNEILALVYNLTEDFNVANDLNNDKVHTIQFVRNDTIFCEYEFDETHRRLTHLTPDGMEKVLLTIGEFIKSVREEMEIMDDVVYYYLSRKEEQ